MSDIGTYVLFGGLVVVFIVLSIRVDLLESRVRKLERKP